MKHIVVVNGPPRAGKDTFIAMLRKAAPCPTEEFSSIEPVRQLLSQVVDLSEKTEADRKLLATVGDALEEHSHFRTHACLAATALFFAAQKRGIFFCHIREPRHIQHLRRLWRQAGCTVTTVLVTGRRAENVTSNPSDAGVLGMDYDRAVTNDGSLADLQRAAEDFLIDLGILSPLV